MAEQIKLIRYKAFVEATLAVSTRGHLQRHTNCNAPKNLESRDHMAIRWLKQSRTTSHISNVYRKLH